MPQLSDNDIFLYTIKYQQQGQTFLNTMLLQYQVFDPSITADYETYGGNYLADREQVGDLILSLRAETVDELAYVDHRFQKIWPTRLAPVVNNLLVYGQKVGPAAPINVAAVFTKRSIVATRYGIGSWHQPGMAIADMQTSGTWKAAEVNPISLALESAFVGEKAVAGQVGTVQGGLWSKNVPARFTNLVSINPQLTIRTMRRRTVGLGI
jgi:hypothetical protein